MNAPATWRSQLLLADASPRVSAQVQELPGLEELLRDQIELGEKQWPSLELPPEKYLRHLADILHRPRISHAGKLMARMAAADVYLAAAVLAGDEQAAELFLNAQRPPLLRALQKLGAEPAMREEVAQRVFDSVLVGERPQLVTYSGRGPLSSWIVTIGVRTCRRLMGSEARRSGDGRALEELPIPDYDLELGYLKKRYAGEFRRAFAVALAELSERQRNILRHQHIGGLSIDALAELYEVHRATAARWAAGARRAILDRTRDELIGALGVEDEEVDSIIRLVRSQLDLSIHSLL